MIYRGTEAECAAVIAQVDAELGYPRGYTQADLDSGLVVRHGRGPWAPIESIRTETCAAPDPVDVDAEGVPTSGRRIVRLPELRGAARGLVGSARVLRVLNRGTQEQLEALPAVGPARASQIIAGRPYASVDDVARTVPPGVVTALRTRGAALAADDDDWEDDSAQASTVDRVRVR